MAPADRGLILPRHLVYYQGLYDTLKLAGRVTLRDRVKYLAVPRVVRDDFAL